MAPLALTTDQLSEVMTVARQIPRALRGTFLQHVADALRGQVIGDGAVHAAAHVAARQVIALGRRQPRERAVTESLPLRASAPT
jgi:hypothetical protein